MTFFMSIRQKQKKSGKGEGGGRGIWRGREETGKRMRKPATDLADLSEEKMQDSMQLYKAYYADMHACPPENPPAGKEDFVDAAEKLCYTFIRYGIPVPLACWCSSAGRATDS